MGQCVIESNDEQFEADVLQQPGPVLVDFYTPTCGPCRYMVPVLEGVCHAWQGRLRVVKIDASENLRVGMQHDLRVVPTFVLYVSGRRVAQFTGTRSSEDLQRWLEASIAA